MSATIDRTQIERAQRIFGLHLEDVGALLPFGSAITVRAPTEARTQLRDLATDLAHHYAPSPTS